MTKNWKVSWRPALGVNFIFRLSVFSILITLKFYITASLRFLKITLLRSVLVLGVMTPCISVSCAWLQLIKFEKIKKGDKTQLLIAAWIYFGKNHRLVLLTHIPTMYVLSCVIGLVVKKKLSRRFLFALEWMIRFHFVRMKNNCEIKVDYKN